MVCLEDWRTWAVVLGLSVVACGSADDDEAFTNCALGELTGTWRVRYQETDGNCGPIPDETAILDPTAEPEAGCVIESSIVSPDKCRTDSAFTCPTTDDRGTQAWVMVLRHVGPGQLSGTGTVQINHPTLGNCRSTYNITMTQL